ncbi:protein-disulfide reductase DsbD family protein [Belliella marina]|uniref:Protein-disulfide reductase DsbD family protein n=1 Tax=Belliella marina TaxID=1644146 RepID=A0ABW4VST4_9BACT
MKYTILALILLFLGGNAFAQFHEPVTWSFESQSNTAGEITLRYTASIEANWHLYGSNINEGGPIPTTFELADNPAITSKGKINEESKATVSYEEMFGMDVPYFENEAVFTQVIKVNQRSGRIKGFVTFMVCDDHQCLPPNEVEFDIEFNTVLPNTVSKSDEVPSSESLEKVDKVISEQIENQVADLSDKNIAVENSELGPLDKPITDTIARNDPSEKKLLLTEETESKKSLWAILIAGFLGGFAALLMPCIFPMLPLTVSYFTKSDNKGSAVGKALIYGISIVVIYVLLGLCITIVFGADALNALSTNGVFNFFFFLLLVVFAASFFGAFELTLPHSWANKLDKKSDKGGLAGLFFMAATLAIVSFSCTGPIIGTLLVQAASMGEYLGPAIGMFGFSVALAIPFALFAMFPSWLQSLPKSGGWLNSVKVVLGFLELALALKFLSNVDLAYHWNWFDREVFLVLWIAIFGLLAMYLLGKIKFAHDSPTHYVSTTRIFLSVVVIGFTIYMIPGLWGAPLKSISAFLPPQHTQDFDIYTPTLGGGNYYALNSGQKSKHRKYGDLFHAPLNLDPFFDYDEGLAYAKKTGKPVLIDFTGHACVNCRKMEANVWPDIEILKIIRDDYVLIQLYVDDKTLLQIEEHYISNFSGKNINTIGKKWSDFQAQTFNANSQPYYVTLDLDGQLLKKPIGAEYNVEKYKQYLLEALQNFDHTK